MNNSKAKDILPQNKSDFSIKYKVEDNGTEGLVWIVMIESGYAGKNYHSSVHITDERMVSCGFESIILEMENAVQKTIEKAVREELFDEHVDGEQDLYNLHENSVLKSLKQTSDTVLPKESPRAFNKPYDQ